MEVDRTAGEIAGQVGGDDSSIRGRFDRQDLYMVAVFAPGRLRPIADGLAAMDVASFIMEKRILSETGSNAIGIIGVGGGEIVRNDLRQLHDP